MQVKLVKEGYCWSQVGLHPHRRRKDAETDTHREKGHVMIQQRLSETTRGPQKLAEARKDPPLEPLEEVCPC